ncbi:helix-turn-helix domain-containing protein [Streptomyces sp. NBC_00669]|uniref:helix-turn-helix domain-containing protein n=1 Tax=Streptomyces sp. NBC_00669 TaxID=2976011 RepID=UPI002E3070CC|nr:helix-turn-helix transcriptional regulator [Streptomyces sp. NBC_00669]
MSTYVEEFASRLRELKHQSGRTYGALAARTHVSTSTLHRYCNGAAVPTEYGPVERFARLCGAGPEELVALHQLWLLASAERRREQYRTSAAPAEPEPAAPGPAAPGPAAPVDVPPDGTDEAAPPDAAGPGATGVAAAGVDGAGADGASRVMGPGDAGAGISAPHPPAAPGPPEAPGPPGPPEAPELPDLAELPEAGGEPSSSWRRRTRVAVGAAAAMAAVLPLVLHSAHGADRGAPAASRPRTTAAAVVGAPAATTSTTAPASPAPTTTASGRKAGAPSRSTAPTTPPAAGSSSPPVQVTVLSDNWDTQCGQWFLLRQPPGKVPPPPSLQQDDAWAGALGGVPAGDLRLQVTAQSVSGQPVVLHALYVRVVSSTAAPKGNGYTPGSGCGGGLEPASFAVDLDTTAPRARPVRGYVDDGSTPVLSTFPFQIARDSQVLDVDAHTSDRDVSWYLELVWTCGDRQGTLRVDDHGKPFRTVGLKNDPTYFYDGSAWSPSTPQS